MPTCSKCGKGGHNARTCGRWVKSKQPSGAKRKAGAAAKRAAAPAPAPAAPPAPLPGGTVLERLRARRAQLVDQLAGAELLRRELQIVESTIEQLEAIEGGA